VGAIGFGPPAQTRFAGIISADALYHVRSRVVHLSGLPAMSSPEVTTTTMVFINDRPMNVPRNAMHGPGLINLDLNVSHDFALSKSREHAKTLSVSLNSFNVLNQC
jgi:hypothetical protein